MSATPSATGEDGISLCRAIAGRLRHSHALLLAGHFKAERFAALDEPGSDPYSFEEATFVAACLLVKVSPQSRILVLVNDIEHPDFSETRLPSRYARLLAFHGLDESAVLRNGGAPLFSERRLRNRFPSKATRAVLEPLDFRRSQSAFSGRSSSFLMDRERKELLTASGSPNCAATSLEIFSLPQTDRFPEAVFFVPDECADHVKASGRANVVAGRMSHVITVSSLLSSLRIEETHASDLH